MDKSGGLVFISHSHLDIKVVRNIRNQLEDLGFDPLLFFLKCLSDDDEIESLIQREIDEREWFIYVDSPNARRSKWVQSERAYIERFPEKKAFVIDSSGNLSEQIDRITRKLKVFISFSHGDEEIYTLLKNKLVEKDFLVLNEDLSGNLTDCINGQIDEAARNGFMLLLVGERQGAWMQLEVQKCLDAGGTIIPIYIGTTRLKDDLLFSVGNLQGVFIDKHPTEEQIDSVVERILHLSTHFKEDFTFLEGFRGAKTIKYPPIGIIPEYAFVECARLEKVYIPYSVQLISDKAFSKEQEDVILVCPKGSYAERYCLRKGRKYIIEDWE